MADINSCLMLSLKKMHKIDFIWSSIKEKIALIPLYNYMKNKRWDVKLKKIHRNQILNSTKSFEENVILGYDETYYRLKKNGWEGKFIYIDHGISPVKYYSYKYMFFQHADLLFYPGPVFKRKMEIINPNFKKGLLGGFTKSNDLINLKINKKKLCEKHSLDINQPIILFAPTWGTKKKNTWGINNINHLKDIPNLITIPHSSDYTKWTKNIIMPKKDSSINEYIKLADIVISDISSILVEAAIINKPTIQIVLDSYPGCFPEPDKKDKFNYISKDIIKKEIQECDLIKRPFKISFLNEDWILGYTSKLENIKKTLKNVLSQPDKFSKERKYWANQCCWNLGKNNLSDMSYMINNFLTNNLIKQK